MAYGGDFTDEELEDLRAAFSMFDRNQDGEPRKKRGVLVVVVCCVLVWRLASTFASSSNIDKDIRNYQSNILLHSIGFIDVNELMCALRKMGFKPSQQEVTEMISSVDDNGDLAIDFTEFLVLMKSHVGNPDSDLRYAFSHFDHDASGYITREKLKRVMNKFDRELTDRELEAIFNEVDTDGDGKITFTEFRALMVRGVLEKWYGFCCTPHHI